MRRELGFMPILDQCKNSGSMLHLARCRNIGAFMMVITLRFRKLEAGTTIGQSSPYQKQRKLAWQRGEAEGKGGLSLSVSRANHKRDRTGFTSNGVKSGPSRPNAV
jgi:hypothetical protein